MWFLGTNFFRFYFDSKLIILGFELHGYFLFIWKVPISYWREGRQNPVKLGDLDIFLLRQNKINKIFLPLVSSWKSMKTPLCRGHLLAHCLKDSILNRKTTAVTNSLNHPVNQSLLFKALMIWISFLLCILYSCYTFSFLSGNRRTQTFKKIWNCQKKGTLVSRLDCSES